MNATNNCFAALICAGIVVLSVSAGETFAEPGESALQLEAKIPLGDVSGRIDHMAIDPNRHRLFVAELGNNSVGVVDLKERKVILSLIHISEPTRLGMISYA